MTPARGRLHRRLAVVAAPAAIVGACVSSCVIAEPSSEVPLPTPQRPHIVRTSVIPPASSVLGTIPATFTIPVELSDPTLTFKYVGFVDYDPIGNTGLATGVLVNTFEPSSINGSLRVVEIGIPPQNTVELDRCHVIEVLVALEIDDRFGAVGAHSPPDPGGDSVTWFYSPTGDLAGCPVLDAGLDASQVADGQGPPP